MDSVGRKLREERQLRGWSQRDLARETGVNPDTISGIETEQHEPRPSTLRKLAEGLGLEVRDFFAEPTVPLGEAPRESGQPEIKESRAAARLSFSGEATPDPIPVDRNRLVALLRDRAGMSDEEMDETIRWLKVAA